MNGWVEVEVGGRQKQQQQQMRCSNAGNVVVLSDCWNRFADNGWKVGWLVSGVRDVCMRYLVNIGRSIHRLLSE